MCYCIAHLWTLKLCGFSTHKSATFRWVKPMADAGVSCCASLTGRGHNLIRTYHNHILEDSLSDSLATSQLYSQKLRSSVHAIPKLEYLLELAHWPSHIVSCHLGSASFPLNDHMTTRVTDLTSPLSTWVWVNIMQKSGYVRNSDSGQPFLQTDTPHV